MFDFNDHYTLDELLALDNFMCYVRASAAEPIDIAQLRGDLNQMHRTLSRVINTKLDEAAEEWDAAHKNTKAYKAVVSEPVTPVMAQQARDHAAAEAEKVDRIKQACVAGAPPAVNCCNIDRCGVCLTDCPYTDEPLPAEEPDDLRALVDMLSRCSNRLAALAAAEDKHFAECSQTEVFNKVTMLRECKQALNNMVSDIRDHYDGLH